MASLISQGLKNLPTVPGDIGDVASTLSQKDPLDGEIVAAPVFLPEKSHGQRSLLGYAVQGCSGTPLSG